MSLMLEIYGPGDRWIRVGNINPGDPPCSVSDNKPDYSRDVYRFECLPDDSKSIVYRCKAGFDFEIGPIRVLDTLGSEIVKELRRGDEPYEMKIKTDRSSEARQLRFTHI